MNQKCICCGGKVLFLYFVSTIPTMILHGMANYLVVLYEEGFLEGNEWIFNLMEMLPFTIFAVILAYILREIEDTRRSEEGAVPDSKCRGQSRKMHDLHR